MRKRLIAGNWKMNMTAREAKQLISQLVAELAYVKDCDMVICPPMIDIQTACEEVKGTNLHLGCQNIHWADKGAYTGEVSGAMLKEFVVEYAIIGHSERRQYFGETNETVNMRVKAALTNGITPIICVGENLSQRENNETDAFITIQVKEAFKDLTVEQAMNCVLAYEPIWAIGTGKTATSQMANDTIAVIRNTLCDCFGKDVADSVRILYGGSMNEKNAVELLAMPEIDGGLIGGASLVAEKFAQICKV